MPLAFRDLSCVVTSQLCNAEFLLQHGIAGFVGRFHFWSSLRLVGEKLRQVEDSLAYWKRIKHRELQRSGLEYYPYVIFAEISVLACVARFHGLGFFLRIVPNPGPRATLCQQQLSLPYPV